MPDTASPPRPYLLASATDLARAIRSGATTSVEVLEAHLAHIERVNPTLNAVVAGRSDAARREAAEMDARIAGGEEVGPFAGVPCTIKESFALTGMPQTSGLVARCGQTATSDATAVARLRAAGAIPMGVTNTSELCMWMETSNRVYGRTRNAYDPARIAGGSSGGEGAIVGAGGAPFGLGADIGGSIRMPAFFNGVFGHKPTGGLVPGTGQYPISENDALRYLCSGPIARRAEDLMPLLRVLAGPDGQDTGCREIELGDPDDVDLAGLEVIDVHGNGLLPVHPGLRSAQASVAHYLRERGAHVRTSRFDALKRSLDIWSAMMSAAAETSFRELLAAGGKVSPLRELGRWSIGRSTYTLPSIVLTLLERGEALMPKRIERFCEMGAALRAEVTEVLGEHGVLLYPSFTSPAPRHHHPLVPPIRWTYTAILNVLEMPVTQVPLGLNGRGLPLGIQVGAAAGNDHLTIAVARHLEDAFGGWVPPRRWFG